MQTKSKTVQNQFGLWALAVLVSLTLVSGALAQTTTSATLRGTVKDPNGAVVPNATVKLTYVTTQTERSTKTNSDGVYTFTSLTPGNYTTVSGSNQLQENGQNRRQPQSKRDSWY